MKNIQTNIAVVGLLAFAACKSAETPPPETKPVQQTQVQQKKVEPAKPVDQVGAANALFAKGEYKAALDSYDAILAKDAGNEAARFNRAVCLHRLGQLGEAKKAYEAVLAKNPDDADATLNLGAILKDEGKIDEAMALYNKLLKKDEFNSKVLNNLAALERTKKQYSKAVETVRKLLMRDQRNIDAYKNLALVYYDQKKYKLSQTILENALKMAETQKVKDADIYVNLGMIQIALGDNGKAMARFKEATAIDPNHIVANYNIGSLALMHRDYELAQKAYTVVAKAWPESYAVNASLGYALQGLQKWDDAAKQLVKARELKTKEATASLAGDPTEDEQIVWQLVQIYQTAEQPETALKYADEYLKMKQKTCRDEDAGDEICGRVIGIKTMIQMKNAPPPEEEKKPKATGKDIFTDAPAEGDEAAAGGGDQPPPEGGDAAKAGGDKGAEEPAKDPAKP